jgi:hypothetical protein
MTIQKKTAVNSYLKYSGMAFQLAFLIAGGYYMGAWCDQKLGFTKPICAMFLILLFFCGFMYQLYKSLDNHK